MRPTAFPAAPLVFELGPYFAEPILTTMSERPEEARLARGILDKSEPWPAAWPARYKDPLSGAEKAMAGIWRAFRRVLSKEAWLSSHKARAPWPLKGKNPPIVAFYSFKGGVGRTTLLGCMAWHYARKGKRVTVIDLDLEAPGVGTLLDAHAPRGVLDLLLDHVVTNRTELDGSCYSRAGALPRDVADLVTVVPAGSMNSSYLEKLARLDYAASAPGGDAASPVARALVALLKVVKSKLMPDAILIDSRAGLHDLGGLSLHALAHVEVLVSRATRQGYDGLRLALDALARRKVPEELQCVAVHSFAPIPSKSEIGQAQRKAFREELYQLFGETVYRDDADAPDVNDETASSTPQVFPRFEVLESLDTISDVPIPVLDDPEIVGVFRGEGWPDELKSPRASARGVRRGGAASRDALTAGA